MREDTANPQINISNIPVSGGIAGAFVAVASMAIFLIGLPVLRYMFPAAIFWAAELRWFFTLSGVRLPARPGFFSDKKK